MEYAVTPSQVPTDASTPKKAAKKYKSADRIVIHPGALTRLSQWSQQLEGSLRGVRLTRSDLVNYLVLDHAEALSTSELKGLVARYFDEVKFAQWACEELKAAKSRGETVSLADIISRHKPVIASVPRPKARKTEAQKPDEKSDKTATKQAHPTPKASLISVEKSSEK